MEELRLEGQTVFLPAGMPCSGKSTMFEAAASLPGIGENLALVCPDAIREDLHPGYEAGVVPFEDIDNMMVFEKADDQLYRLVVDGYDVWFDAINLHPHRRGRMFEVELAEEDPAFSGDHVRFIVIHLDVPFEEILRRNQTCRVAHRRPPVERLEKMFEWFQEGADQESPGDLMDVWKLTWDGTWKPAEGFTPGPVCSALIEATNAAASPSRRRRS